MIITMTQLHSWPIIAIVMPGGALMYLQSESQFLFTQWLRRTSLVQLAVMRPVCPVTVPFVLVHPKVLLRHLRGSYSIFAKAVDTRKQLQVHLPLLQLCFNYKVSEISFRLIDFLQFWSVCYMSLCRILNDFARITNSDNIYVLIILW